MSMSDPWQTPPHLPPVTGLGIALLVLLVGIGAVVLLHPVRLPAQFAPAVTLRQARMMFKRGDYPVAADLFTTFAKQNNPTAKYWLGHMNEFGLGMPRDVTSALKLYKQAAAQDVCTANLRLGEIYLHGNLVPPDFSKAKTYLTRAADQKDAEAAMLLGEMYRRGLGNASDPTKAFAWLEVASIEGNQAARRLRDQSLNSLDPGSQRAASTLANNFLRSMKHGAARSENLSPVSSSAQSGADPFKAPKNRKAT
jgi:TPR repeat protein